MVAFNTDQIERRETVFARPPAPQDERPAGISLTIPAYNEEDRIGKALESYLPVLRASGLQYEVNVIIDGNDGTEAVANAYSALGVKCHKFNRKLGKGGAIFAGIRMARYSITGYVDADGSLSAVSLAEIIRLARDYDCVVGSRWIVGSAWDRKEPLFNRVAGRVFNILVRGMLGVPIRDTQCGVKFFRTHLITELLSKTVVTNRTFDIDILYHARRDGRSMVEVPVRWSHDERTRMPILRVIPIMLLTLIGIRVMNLPLRRYVPKAAVDFFVSRYARD